MPVEAPRFFLVSLGGVAVDLAVATVGLLLGLTPVAASLCGLAVATGGAYVFHARWTFAHLTDGRLHWRGFAGFAAGTVLVALARLGFITWLGPFFPEGTPWSTALLAGAAAASFCVNFVFSKLVVFIK